MKCKHCNREMVLDTSKILISNSPKQIYTCPKCGSIEYVTSTTVPYDLDSGMIIVDENNPYPVTSKLEVGKPSDEEMKIRADERKKVAEEIREKLKKAGLEIMSPINLYSYTDNFLYQVEKGE